MIDDELERHRRADVGSDCICGDPDPCEIRQMALDAKARLGALIESRRHVVAGLTEGDQQ
jgi:hypothetical protein